VNTFVPKPFFIKIVISQLEHLPISISGQLVDGTRTMNIKKALKPHLSFDICGPRAFFDFKVKFTPPTIK
jgi:hypothetical protein